MELNHICGQIENAGAWLPLTVVRQAFTQHEALTPILFDAVRQRAAAPTSPDIRLAKLITFFGTLVALAIFFSLAAVLFSFLFLSN